MRLAYNFLTDTKETYLCISEITDVFKNEENYIYFETTNNENYVSVYPIDESSYEWLIAELLHKGYARLSDNFIYDEFADDNKDEK